METKGDALIGYTGFVGSNIQMQRPFSLLYNSKNIEEIQGKEFNLVVCAAAPGTKWMANKNPEADLASIKRLMDSLGKIKCEKLVLVSTVDVYDPVKGVDEDSAIDKEKLKPYGKHRRMLEEFAENNFDTLIVRLPGIFGTGLKKNIIFDLIQGDIANVNPNNILQFYWLNSLWADISKALDNKLKSLNIGTEPILIKELAKEVFGLDLPAQPTASPVTYDMRTKHAHLWGMDEPYLYGKDKILDDLKTFIKNSSK